MVVSIFVDRIKKMVKLLKEFIGLHNEMKFFDAREHLGCSSNELNELAQMIHPHAVVPKILYEYLEYCGKWYWNSGQTYNELLRSLQFPYWQEFLHDRDFWVTEYNEESSVICGFKISELHKDDPPYYTSETLEVADLYQLFPSYLSEERIEQVLNRAIKTDEYFTSNPKIYAVKKAIVDLYSLLEGDAQLEQSSIPDELRKLASNCYSAAHRKVNKDNFLMKSQYNLKLISSIHKISNKYQREISELIHYVEEFQESLEGEN